jgi:hypothetical protein
MRALVSILVVLGFALSAPASARTVADLRQEIAARKAELAILERQLREVEQGTAAGTVVPPPEEEDIDRALERTLVREGAIVLPAFSYELTPYASWAHWDSVQNPAVSNSFGAGLTFRMGLPWRSQFSASLPYVVDKLRNGGTSAGLADAGFLFSSELFQETEAWPTLVGSVGWTSPTSSACCSGPIPYVSGLHAGVTAAKRFDPLVAFASLSYFSALSRKVAGTLEDPTDIVGARLGASLAVTPSLSLTGTINLAWLTNPAPHDLPVHNSDRILTSLDLGVSTIVWPKTLLTFTTQVGLTGNLPDVRLITSLPVRF